MQRPTRIPLRKRRGSVLLLSIIFIALFSALGVAMAAMSGTNVQLASNQRHASQALSSAQSGLEIVRYYLSSLSISASVAPGDRLEALATDLQTAFDNAGCQGTYAQYNAGTETMTISNITLNAQTNERFSASMSFGATYDDLTLVVTGRSQNANKQVAVDYQFNQIGNPIFDYGVATRGPLSMQGNVDVEGYNEVFEASVYIESSASTLALEMTGKSSIAGDVTIANGAALVDIANQSSVGGESGTDALDNVTIGATMCEFPVADPAVFEPYIQHTFDPATDPTSNVTLTNVEIPAGTNPSFSGHAVVRGIMYIRSPNIVSFTGNAEVHGLILAEGEVDFPSENNHLDFGGNVDSYGVDTLPSEEFGDLRDYTGTFLLAPGFSVCFRGNFDCLNGVIAASGVEFNGNAGGTINGSVINYSDDCMSLAGNTDLVFNRSGVEKNPAGFQPSMRLDFLADSYYEPAS
jgi:hypothetical protein